MAQPAGAQFDRLVDIMRTLRAPGGCPWDREQTLASLKPFKRPYQGGVDDPAPLFRKRFTTGAAR